MEEKNENKKNSSHRQRHSELGLGVKIRHLRALWLYYKHVKKLGGKRLVISSTKKFIAQSIGNFNLLNWIFKRLSSICFLFGLKRPGLFFKYAFQEESGINRHVLVRYLMKELFLYFLLSFVFFFMTFFVNQILLVAENILKQRVPVKDVARLILYSLPTVISQSAPFATLVGFLMCLGRLATENEILILRASGQRYRIILIPVLVLGLLISVVSFFVNDYLLPLGYINYAKLYREIQTSNPSVTLEPNSVKRTNEKTLVIGDVFDDHVSDLIFFDLDSDENQRIIVAANSTVKQSKDAGILMQLSMNNSTVAIFDRNNKVDFDVLSADNIQLNVFESTVSKSTGGTSPREMTSYDLYEKIKDMKKEGGTSKKVMNQYELEYHKKFSIPFGALFFALLALPLALLFGKHNGQTIGLIIGIVISVMYWAVNILGQIFSSKSGVGGIPIMWLPDAVIGIAGLFFYLKLIRK